VGKPRDQSDGKRDLALITALAVAISLLMASGAGARTKVAAHFGMGADLFHHGLGPNKDLRTVARFTALKLELGIDWYFMKNVIVALDFRPELRFHPSTEAALGFVLGFRYFLTSNLYARFGLPLYFHPRLTLGILPGLGVELGIGKKVSLFLELAVPIGFLVGGDKATSLGLSFLGGAKFFF